MSKNTYFSFIYLHKIAENVENCSDSCIQSERIARGYMFSLINVSGEKLGSESVILALCILISAWQAYSGELQHRPFPFVSVV